MKELLRQKGFSYRTLSKATGIPLTTLNTKIQKQSAFTVDEMLTVCNAIGADPREELHRFAMSMRE